MKMTDVDNGGRSAGMAFPTLAVEKNAWVRGVAVDTAGMAEPCCPRHRMFSRVSPVVADALDTGIGSRLVSVTTGACQDQDAQSIRTRGIERPAFPAVACHNPDSAHRGYVQMSRVLDDDDQNSGKGSRP